MSLSPTLSRLLAAVRPTQTTEPAPARRTNLPSPDEVMGEFAMAHAREHLTSEDLWQAKGEPLRASLARLAARAEAQGLSIEAAWLRAECDAWGDTGRISTWPRDYAVGELAQLARTDIGCTLAAALLALRQQEGRVPQPRALGAAPVRPVTARR